MSVPFPTPKTETQVEVNSVKKELNDLGTDLGPETLKKYLILEKRLEELLQNSLYEGVNPKEINTKDLLAVARSYFGSDDIERKYKKKIRSPLTAVRSFCIDCMGGSMVGVRECTSCNCPLWPFRLGKNPFFNMPSADAETTEDMEEDADPSPVVT